MDGVNTGSTLLPPGDAGRLAAFLREGGRVAVLTGASRGDGTAVLDAAFWASEGRVIRTGNPLSTPLSLSRLLLQVGADPHAEDEARALQGEIAAQAEGRGVVLSIDDAHTLEPDVWPALRELLWPEAAEPAAVKLVLAGRAGLPERLAEAGFRGLDDPAQTLVMRIGPDDGVAEDTAGVSVPRPVMSEPVIPPPPAPLVTAVRAGEPPPPSPPPPLPAIPLPPARPVLVRRSPSTLVEEGAEGDAPGVAGPGRRRWRVLALAALTGLCTGVVLGLTVLWLLGALDFVGLPPSPLRRFLSERILARSAAMSIMPAASVPAPGLAGPGLAGPALAAPQPAAAPGGAPAPAEAGPAVGSPAAVPQPAATVVAPEGDPAPAPTAPAPAAVPDEAPKASPAVAPPVPVQATQMAAAPPVVVVPGTTEARLRRDFNAYLRHTGWSGTARTPEAREALFRDYKTWLARNRTGLAPGRADAAP